MTRCILSEVNIACPISEWQSPLEEAISVKKAKIVVALMSLVSLVLSCGAFLTWK